MAPSEDVRSATRPSRASRSARHRTGRRRANEPTFISATTRATSTPVFVAFDDDPARRLAPRENIENDDRVGLLIDTFDDQRTGYGFQGQPTGRAMGRRWSEVARGGYDSSFEAVWYTDAQLTAGGYVVLMTIPFRTMRFPESLEQRWRIGSSA